jgi:cytochrome c biogenesis protein
MDRNQLRRFGQQRQGLDVERVRFLMPATEATRAAPGWAHRIASPKLSAVFFVVAAAAALWASTPGRSATLAMLVPFSLLALNLLAAIVTNRRFRTDLPLLVFHLALLALVVTFAIARLTYYEGQATVTAGTTFQGDMLAEESGALHARRIDDVRFKNLGFTENYPARGHYQATYNRVQWQTVDGTTHTADIGDDVPLILHGYRIYTSRHRGFSPVFRWQKSDGTDEMGTVQLRDSNNSFAGANDWTLPDGRPAWLMVDIDTPAAASEGHVRANLGADLSAHRLVLRIGDARHILVPGEQLALPQGTLTYVRLGSWMGYRLVFDPTKPWLIGSIALAVLALVSFYSRIVFRPIPATSTRP